MDKPSDMQAGHVTLELPHYPIMKRAKRSGPSFKGLMNNQRVTLYFNTHREALHSHGLCIGWKKKMMEMSLKMIPFVFLISNQSDTVGGERVQKSSKKNDSYVAFSV